MNGLTVVDGLSASTTFYLAGPVNSSYGNASTDVDPFSVDDGFNDRYAISGFFFLVLVLIPNVLVALVLLLGKPLRQRNFSDWLLLNMAILSNLVMFSIAATIAEIKYVSGVYPGRRRVCYLQACALVMNNVSNQLTVTLLSAERCAAMMRPFFYTHRIVLNLTVISLTIAFIWTVTIALSLAPILYGGKIVLQHSFCQPKWSDSSNVVFAMLYVTVSGAATALTVLLNAVTIRSIARLHKGMRRRMSPSSSFELSRSSSAEKISVRPVKRKQELGPRRLRRTISDLRTSGRSRQRMQGRWMARNEFSLTRMILVVTFLFTIVSVPLLIRIIIEAATGQDSAVATSIITQRLGAFNAFLIPILYCLLCKSYRAELQVFMSKAKRTMCCSTRPSVFVASPLNAVSRGPSTCATIVPTVGDLPSTSLSRAPLIPPHAFGSRREMASQPATCSAQLFSERGQLPVATTAQVHLQYAESTV